MVAYLPWTPWHQVLTLRDDLRSGALPMHMFAADLYEVLIQSGKRPIYEDPTQFFALTFPTFNLRQLVRDVVLRVAGRNSKAVRQLELTYGGGKTHTLITLRHLVADPANLPNLPAVAEFREAIGEPPPKTRVAGLCFDKLDVEKGMVVLNPQGESRLLKHPWSVLAWQLAGEAGLKLLHVEELAEERESAPAENLLTELLEMPTKEGLGVLILMDEVLMFVREKVAADHRWRDRMINFFQYLTQAVTKVDRCCLVVSLLASDPNKSDTVGRQLQGELYDIFQRQREEAVEPVIKEDVAEVLRRRFFTPQSLQDRDRFRPHVHAAMKGIMNLDDQTRRQGADAEERFLKSYPFHPNLIDIFYTKWTNLDRFQKTRGVLRTFALALREAELWDQDPLIGPGVFLTAPGKEGLSEALRELVTVADTEEHEGHQQRWTGVIEGEMGHAREIQDDSMGLSFREIEKAVLAVFLHSQPIGMQAQARDLELLLGATRSDTIELTKGLVRWAQVSFWLDDLHTDTLGGKLPGTWRLGNRPNLTQMHAVAANRINDIMVRARLLDEVSKVKSLTAGVAASGVKNHLLPATPRDIEDDGVFHYAVLGLNAASDSGKPSAEAVRFLEETTGPEKPRVFRNAVLMLAPSRDGVEMATARVRDYLAWELVHTDLKEQGRNGNLDVARLQTLAIHLDTSRGRIPAAIRQAWSTVITVSEQNKVHAFKINVSDDNHFSIIKNDPRSRIQESAITAEALLPDGPYNLWRNHETSRRVKDLAGAFAQLPHLPKMLKSQAILDTLTEGCAQGAFVLRLPRPDQSFRTWWRSRPDEASRTDLALELVLPETASLAEIHPDLLLPGTLPGLWKGEELSIPELIAYFTGGNIVQVQREGYQEPVAIPQANQEVIYTAVRLAVGQGKLWLINTPCSVLADAIPTGMLGSRAILRSPPAAISAVEILPENLPDAWENGETRAMIISNTLSMRGTYNLPWKVVKDVITAALNARFLELDETSGVWPCDYVAANLVKLKVPTGKKNVDTEPVTRKVDSKSRIAKTDLEPSEIQDLADILPQLLAIKAQANIPMRFSLEIELGNDKKAPPEERVREINKILEGFKKGFFLQ
ncbi:MAG: ATP-binding protein [Magnetococcales bacterium]|nr:ATP-binding protein [Magnetococcales bacterium]